MNHNPSEHDLRALAPKLGSVAEGQERVQWGRDHVFCQSCGAGEYGVHVLTTHEIIGGRGGRSQEPCNWLRLGMHPCHDLATGLDVRVPALTPIGPQARSWPPEEMRPHTKTHLLPKLTLAIQLSLKIRAGELAAPLLIEHPGSVEPIISDEWKRLTVLHGRTLPEPAAIPEFFAELWRRNRPELNGR